jgi:hypothetical protein
MSAITTSSLDQTTIAEEPIASNRFSVTALPDRMSDGITGMAATDHLLPV